MQSLVIVIILLSLIGIYINLGTKTELNIPEFNKENEENEENEDISPDDVSIDDIKNAINLKRAPKYDVVGNNFKTGEGLVPGKTIINVKINSGNDPDTRNEIRNNYIKERNDYGLPINSLSHEDNFPYNAGYMSPIQARDNLNSKIDIASKNPKGMGARSQVILPKDETNFKENLKFNGRAIAILRNQVSNQNKNIPYTNKVNRHEIVHRASRQIHRIIKDTVELKDFPDEIEANSSRDASIIKDKINAKKYDESKNSIETMRNNYNFK